MGTFRNLVAWQRSMELVDEVYMAVKTLPKSELYGLSPPQSRFRAISRRAEDAGGFGRNNSSCAMREVPRTSCRRRSKLPFDKVSWNRPLEPTWRNLQIASGAWSTRCYA